MDDSHRTGGKAAARKHLRPETRRLIVDVLKAIEPPYRDVLWMHDAEGRPVTAIATALSTRESTVRAWLRDARRKFELAVAHLRRRSVPFADDVPPSLVALREADRDGPDVPFGPSEDLLRQMALTLRVLNPTRLAASLTPEAGPPDSTVRSRPANPRPPGRRA
jgi:hypothetical protein